MYEVILELDAAVEAISPDFIAGVKSIIARLLPGVAASDVHIELLPGSVVLRITVIKASQPATQLAMDGLMQALRGPELQGAIPFTPVEAVSTSWGDWTGWFSSPLNSTGDEELVNEILAANPSVCVGRPPVAVYCQSVDGVPWRETGDVLQLNCSLAAGGLRCLNRDNPGGCKDYRMRIKCPAPTEAPTPATPAPSPALDLLLGFEANGTKLLAKTPAPSTTPYAPSTTATPSVTPSRPLGCDSSCSGHGLCIDRLSGDCRCDSGWLPPDCSEPPITVAITADTNECQGAAVRLPMPSTVPGEQYVQCQENRSSFNAESYVYIRLIVQPLGPVTCRMGTNRSDEVSLSLTDVTLQPDLTEMRVPIRGVIDGITDGVQPFAVTVKCSSRDRRYDAAQQDARAYNQDVPFIRITRIVPISATVPFIGGQVVIEGENFDYPSLKVTVDGMEVTGPRIVRCEPEADALCAFCLPCSVEPWRQPRRVALRLPRLRAQISLRSQVDTHKRNRGLHL